MYKLQGNDLQKVKSLFERYCSNQSVIFSVFENRFDGYAYVDDVNTINWAVLQTPFLQHFIAGSPVGDCVNEIENILFNIILQEQAEKEIAVFTDAKEWDIVLQDVFQKHNGVTDFRKIFDFSLDNYRNVERSSLPDDVKPILEKCKALPFSHIDTWSAKIIINGQIATYCNVIMVGQNKAEIDIYTDEAFRGKGYATIAVLSLIDKILKDGLTPTWSTWPFRIESQHIAKKLGFASAPDAKAWIWQEGM